MNQVLNKFVRAAYYLSAVQIYLRDNFLLTEPLKRKYIIENDDDPLEITNWVWNSR